LISVKSCRQSKILNSTFKLYNFKTQTCTNISLFKPNYDFNVTIKTKFI
jgi:hypothetical protein